MKIFRLYYDMDEEVNWLHKMSSNGWALKDFFLGLYTFVPCEPGEYIYQIDLLDDHGDEQDYLEFLEDSGVEVVARWFRWVYLRKKAEDGPFEMYTDIDSKINYYTKVKKFFQTALILEIICLLIELGAALTTKSPIYFSLTILIGIIALALLRMVWKCQWKIEQLNREK